MTDTPESQVPTIKTVGQMAGYAASYVGFGNCEPPQMLTADPALNGTAKLLFDNSKDPANPNLRRSQPANIIIRNAGTAVIAIAYNTPPSLTSNPHVYHDLIAAGAADEDGNGAALPIMGFIGKIYLTFSAAGTKRAAITVVYANR